MTDQTTPQAIALAEDLLDGEWITDDSYRYYAEETQSYWRVSKEDLAKLGHLLSTHDDAYSTWCADISTDAVEE